MSRDKYLGYRGDVKAVTTVGDEVVFVTAHPEGQPTAVYRLDPAKMTLSEDALPAGGTALLAADDDLWVAGSDRKLYRLPAKGGKAKAVGATTDADPVALAPLAGDRLAVAAGPVVLVVSCKSGKTVQSLELPASATCLASDPTGNWLAVGTTSGVVAVFEAEGKPDAFVLSESAPLHEAAVTALLFEPDDLRVLSAGADQKLLSTHARGKLEPEDRGKGATHEQPITAMTAGPAGRFLTGSGDATLKSWPRGKGARPVTLKDGVGKAVGLAVVTVHGKPQVVAACDDDTLRFFHLDDEGKFGDPEARVHGFQSWAKHELGQGDPKRREAALRTLTELPDELSLKRVAAQMTGDRDHALRLLACKLLGESKHPGAARALEKGLQSREEAVRLLAFDGLRRLVGPGELRPLALALKVEKADVGMKAVEALVDLAKKDDQAMARLTAALKSSVTEVRSAALLGLERIHPADSPEASLAALTTDHPDLRKLALLRLSQRKLLSDASVQAALRWRGDDPDPEVRRVAFLLSLGTREKLLKELRKRDTDLDRQLTELESVEPTKSSARGGLTEIVGGLMSQLSSMLKKQQAEDSR